MTGTETIIQSSDSNTEQKILAAIDFSSDSKAALVWACKYADCFHGRLILLHVVHDSAAHPGFYQSKNAEHMESMQSVAESMMDEFLERLKIEHPDHLDCLEKAELHFVPGLPPSRIVEVAELLNVDIIAMGSRGLTSLEHMRLGSVVKRVLELVPKPVVVIKTESPGKKTKKEIKTEKKKLKKERKRLKSILKTGHEPETTVDASGE